MYQLKKILFDMELDKLHAKRTLSNMVDDVVLLLMTLSEVISLL